MKRTQFHGVKIAGLVALAFLPATMLPPVVSAQSASPAYTDVAGKWTGYVTWPSGSSDETIWAINPDGTFSIQTDMYTAVGALKSRGTDYAFSYERNGQMYTGTLVPQQSSGRPRLVGRGEAPNGPMTITLTR